MTTVPTITVQELATAMASPNPPQVLDVREDHEVAASHIEGVVHIPLKDLPTRLEDLILTQPVAVICRSGGRSAKATEFLHQAGFTVANVQGGMLAYRAEVAPDLPPVL